MADGDGSEFTPSIEVKEGVARLQTAPDTVEEVPLDKFLGTYNKGRGFDKLTNEVGTTRKELERERNMRTNYEKAYGPLNEKLSKMGETERAAALARLTATIDGNAEAPKTDDDWLSGLLGEEKPGKEAARYITPEKLEENNRQVIDSALDLMTRTQEIRQEFDTTFKNLGVPKTLQTMLRQAALQEGSERMQRGENPSYSDTVARIWKEAAETVKSGMEADAKRAQEEKRRSGGTITGEGLAAMQTGDPRMKADMDSPEFKQAINDLLGQML